MLQSFRRLVLSEYGLAFCLSLCLLFGLTYQQWLTFDLNESVDPKTYWGLAHFDFDQSVVRKYRVVEPFMVAGMNWLLVTVVRLFKPGALSGDFSMRLCFYIFNINAAAMLCVLSYAYVRSLNRSKAASLVAILMIVTSPWTQHNTAAFMTDNFSCCFIALTFLGISLKNTKMIVFALLVGPFAKESYLFLLPIIFFFSHIPRWKALAWFLLSGILVFSYRYLYDQLTGHVMKESLNQDVEHFTYLISNSHRFLEPGYVNSLIATIGFWFLIPVAAMVLIRGFAQQFFKQVRPYMIFWAVLVLLQMLMSGDLSRMCYIYLPVYAFFIACAIDAWRDHQSPFKEKGSMTGTL